MTDPMHDLAAPYALDAVDEAERTAFETHLSGCVSCQREVAEFRDAAALLGGAAATSPPPDLRARVLSQLASTPQVGAASPPGSTSHARAERVDDVVVDLGARRRGRPWLLTAAAAMIVAVLGVGALAVVRSSDGGGGGGPDRAAILAAGDQVTVALAALSPEAEGGSVQVVWSPSLDAAVVTAAGLDEPAEGTAYALWVRLDDDEVAPAGLFGADNGRIDEVLNLDDLEATGWGVTIEPDGGSPQPTGDVLYAGTH